jgi:hypothetical protein
MYTYEGRKTTPKNLQSSEANRHTSGKVIGIIEEWMEE